KQAAGHAANGCATFPISCVELGLVRSIKMVNPESCFIAIIIDEVSDELFTNLNYSLVQTFHLLKKDQNASVQKPKSSPLSQAFQISHNDALAINKCQRDYEESQKSRMFSLLN
ncbi:31_t:CDS:2, partial [Funneliformis mosseae]